MICVIQHGVYAMRKGKEVLNDFVLLEQRRREAEAGIFKWMRLKRIKSGKYEKMDNKGRRSKI